MTTIARPIMPDTFFTGAQYWMVTGGRPAGIFSTILMVLGDTLVATTTMMPGAGRGGGQIGRRAGQRDGSRSESGAEGAGVRVGASAAAGGRPQEQPGSVAAGAHR
jgi:hypothetical protein